MRLGEREILGDRMDVKQIQVREGVLICLRHYKACLHMIDRKITFQANNLNKLTHLIDNLIVSMEEEE